MSAIRPPVRGLFRGGCVAWLAAWFVLWDELGPYFVVSINRWPARLPFFPWPFDTPLVATAAYVAPIGVAALLLRPTVPSFRLAAVVATACAATLLLHGDAYNDATFLVGVWMGLWLLWLTRQAERTDAGVVEEASALLVLIGSFLFLGGVVGKLHREWWNGDVMQHVLVEQRTFWFYPWLRAHLPGDTQLLVARWSSRVAVAFEAVAVFAPVMPLRWGLVTLVVASLGVIACAGWSLFSVLGAPIGAALVCLWSLRRRHVITPGSSAIATDIAP